MHALCTQFGFVFSFVLGSFSECPSLFSMTYRVRSYHFVFFPKSLGPRSPGTIPRSSLRLALRSPENHPMCVIPAKAGIHRTCVPAFAGTTARGSSFLCVGRRQWIPLEFATGHSTSYVRLRVIRNWNGESEAGRADKNRLRHSSITYPAGPNRLTISLNSSSLFFWVCQAKNAPHQKVYCVPGSATQKPLNTLERGHPPPA